MSLFWRAKGVMSEPMEAIKRPMQGLEGTMEAVSKPIEELL